MAFIPLIGPLIAGIGGAGATAGGTVAAAGTAGLAAAGATTAAAGGGVLSTVGTALSVGAPIASGIYSLMVASNNAAMARENARRAFEQGNKAAQEQDDLTRAAIGEQLSIQSASGLSLNSGSQMLTRKATRRLGRQDALNAREAGDIRSFNFRQEANNFMAEGVGSFIGGLTSGASNAMRAGSLIGERRFTRRRFQSYAPNPVPRPQSLVF